jgi:hypothetical protein
MVEAAVLRIREDSNNAWGGRKIVQVLRDAGEVAAPAAKTRAQPVETPITRDPLIHRPLLRFLL